MAVARESKAALSLVVDNAASPGPRRPRAPASPAPPPVRAALPALTADMTVAAACHAILQSCFMHLLDNRLPVLKGDDPEGVHQARVAMRRLRAAIAIFHRLMPNGELAELGAEARWLAGELGPARDLDVFVGEIFAPVARRLGDEPGIAAYRATAQAMQAEARERARRALRSRRFRLWRDRLRNWLAANIAPPSAAAIADMPTGATGPLLQPVTGFAAEVLERRDRQARRRGRHLARLAVEQRHELRLQLKKLRYAAEFFADAFEARRATRYIGRLAKLQDGLGYLNDKAVAQELMATIENTIRLTSPELGADARYVNGLVLGWHESAHDGDERALRKAWKKFAETPGYWQ